mmetsp:Transcript_21184/g.42046  ORF Transcript_21184/g.42046 Transcript_21184/m.42046 type:complete len:599 (+) Transcript_21184:97-1893(+)
MALPSIPPNKVKQLLRFQERQTKGNDRLRLVSRRRELLEAQSERHVRVPLRPPPYIFEKSQNYLEESRARREALRQSFRAEKKRWVADHPGQRRRPNFNSTNNHYIVRHPLARGVASYARTYRGRPGPRGAQDMSGSFSTHLGSLLIPDTPPSSGFGDSLSARGQAGGYRIDVNNFQRPPSGYSDLARTPVSHTPASVAATAPTDAQEELPEPVKEHRVDAYIFGEVYHPRQHSTDRNEGRVFELAQHCCCVPAFQVNEDKQLEVQLHLEANDEGLIDIEFRYPKVGWDLLNKHMAEDHVPDAEPGFEASSTSMEKLEGMCSFVSVYDIAAQPGVNERCLVVVVYNPVLCDTQAVRVLWADLPDLLCGHTDWINAVGALADNAEIIASGGAYRHDVEYKKVREEVLQKLIGELEYVQELNSPLPRLRLNTTSIKNHAAASKRSRVAGGEVVRSGVDCAGGADDAVQLLDIPLVESNEWVSQLMRRAVRIGSHYILLIVSEVCVGEQLVAWLFEGREVGNINPTDPTYADYYCRKEWKELTKAVVGFAEMAPYNQVIAAVRQLNLVPGEKPGTLQLVFKEANSLEEEFTVSAESAKALG